LEEGLHERLEPPHGALQLQDFLLLQRDEVLLRRERLHRGHCSHRTHAPHAQA
jgi:hypothetical protein